MDTHNTTISVARFAELTGIAASTINRWIRERKTLPPPALSVWEAGDDGNKTQRRIVVAISALQELVALQRARAGGQAPEAEAVAS